MGYKFKPNKSVAKRFGVSKTGKIKRHHSFTSHLMSSRTANKRRKLRQPEILFEGHARNMRHLMGIEGTRPRQIAHNRRLAAAEAAEAKQTDKTTEPETKKKK
ncbi:MAG TPA: 50S ribosomal protein L35 [Tepidisphaeraceae bacterium]|nr:50S ribosomal protein L35 [Tepidisphaeraceae bacterium]